MIRITKLHTDTPTYLSPYSTNIIFPPEKIHTTFYLFDIIIIIIIIITISIDKHQVSFTTNYSYFLISAQVPHQSSSIIFHCKACSETRTKTQSITIFLKMMMIMMMQVMMILIDVNHHHHTLQRTRRRMMIISICA